MNDVIRAPWTSEQVQALNNSQEHGRREPRICGAEQHAIGRSPLLDATHSGWLCPDPACTYTQDWEWRGMVDYGAGIRDAARTASGQQPETEPVGRCPVMLQGGGRCEKRADHRPPGSDDPHTPEPRPATVPCGVCGNPWSDSHGAHSGDRCTPAVGQPAEAQATDRAAVLGEAADAIDARQAKLDAEIRAEYGELDLATELEGAATRSMAAHLRRMAEETRS